MPVIKLSKEAAIKARRTSEETFRDLVANTDTLKNELYMQYRNLNDKATTKKLMEMFSALESLQSQLKNNFNDIEEFCDKTIRWIEEWNSK